MPTMEHFAKKKKKKKSYLAHFLSPSSKNKITHPEKWKFLIFSQKKAFLVFRETKTPKFFFIYQEKELSCISGNRNPEKNPYISGSNFPSSKNKKNLP